MKSGKLTNDQKISTRYFVISSLEEIIKESVYYRSHSEILNVSTPVISLNIYENEMKAKLL